MKKVLVLFLTICIMLCFCSCDGNDNPSISTNENYGVNTTDNTAESSTENTIETSSVQEDTSKTERKYVETFTIYAEEGAVVTWFDPQTGEFNFKEKCETCGNVDDDEHCGLYLITQGQSKNVGFTCSNTDCSMWGKSQRAIITCEVSGKWVEI